MRLHKDSHVDHGLTEGQLAYLLQRFGDHNAFFVATIELPEALGTVPCGLYGPSMGDAPVAEEDVVYVQRLGRTWVSRLLPMTAGRRTRQVTVVAGPHDGEACVLFSAFGGPSAPQEPGDPGCRDQGASVAFWNQHALSSF